METELLAQAWAAHEVILLWTSGAVGMRIVLYEPVRAGVFHAHFNAALLQTALLAYPGSRAVFVAEREHVDRVRQVWERHIGSSDASVEWTTRTFPPRRLWSFRRVPWEVPWCRELLALADDWADLVLLCSVGDTGLIVLKTLMHLRPPKAPVLAALHGELGAIDGPQPRKPWNWICALRQALRMPHPRQLRYVVLGESILRRLEEVLPQTARHCRWLDLPCLWPAEEKQADDGDPQAIRFGFFGDASREAKGFDLFCRLARANRDAVGEGRCQFVLVGFPDGPMSTDEAVRSHVEGIGNEAIAGDEYARRAHGLTYAVWTGRPEVYRLSASTSFLDALAYVKPGVCLRSPYVEHCFGRMGDIGYLCDDEDQMQAVIEGILAEFPRDRYAMQRETILRERRLFSREVLAPGLRAIADECIQMA